MTASKGPDGDIERQAEIDSLPETLTVEYEDGTKTEVPYRASAQAADDDWRRFRDSEMGKMILGADLNAETNP